MRVLVTGAAGFLGNHLTRALLARGDEVVGLDNFVTSSVSTLADLLGHPAFTLIEADVCTRPRIAVPLDAIAHLACPASPADYLRLPLETLAIGSRASDFVLSLAQSHQARVLLASTSEVYGDPGVSPQHEEYWGNVNPIGPRSVYDEAKRFAEATFSAHRRVHGTNTGIVRIFNTYGPGLRPHDGRVVSNFIAQALRNEALTIYGAGTQTRSFCYVDDLVRGLVAMLDSDASGPLNLGNPAEVTVLHLATIVRQLTGSTSPIGHLPAVQDDPTRRCPDVSLAARELGWQPAVPLEEGLRRTIAWQASLRTNHLLTFAAELEGVSHD